MFLLLGIIALLLSIITYWYADFITRGHAIINMGSYGLMFPLTLMMIGLFCIARHFWGRE